MSIDVTCPACGGSIQIEEVAEVVACPLCQMHLQVDPETNEPELVSEDAEEEATEAETETSTAAASAEDSATAAESDQSEADEPEAESESASPFSFLPGGNDKRAEEKKEERPANQFSFLPGGSDDSPAAETTETAEDAEESAETELESAAESEETENAGLESIHAFAKVEAETPNPFDLSDTESETESQFSFVPVDTQAEDKTEVETEEATDSTEETAAEPAAEADSSNAMNEDQETETTAEESTTSAETDAESTAEAGTETESAAEPTSEQPTTAAAPVDYRRKKVVSKSLFTLTLTYAIAATIMVALLLYAKYMGDPHQLESLPDLKPPMKNDEIALQLIPENAELPPGHVLMLGGPGRRFGNVLVTPLRVTRGPLEFEHYTGDASRTREPSQDVLKLYLKFENVSKDQTFEPLDQKLLLTRVSGKNPDGPMRANNFVSRVDQKKTDGERVLTYDMPPSWEWNLKGQNINQEAQPQKLEPGQSFETYVATNEAGIDDLKGELVWRLQLRKGYHPKSYRGVTTLIEVVFNSDQIENETSAGAEKPLPTS